MNRLLSPILLLAAASCISFAQEPPAPKPPPARLAVEPDPFAPTAAGEEEAVPAPLLIQIQVEFVETSLEKASELLLTPPATADASALREELRKLTKAGEAKLLDIQLLTGRSGEKQLAESIQEFIYPTEYEPWEVPNEIDVPDKPGGLSPDDVNALDRLVTPATPTSFETRNLGSTLETEPTAGSENRIIDLRLSPTLVWHTGNTVWTERKDSLGNVARIEMPVMYTLKLETALTLKSGKPVLAGMLSPKDAEGKTDLSRKVMVFVKGDLLEVK